jgi:hypothetical protein
MCTRLTGKITFLLPVLMSNYACVLNYCTLCLGNVDEIGAFLKDVNLLHSFVVPRPTTYAQLSCLNKDSNLPFPPS